MGVGYKNHPGLTTHATGRAGPDVAHPSAEGNLAFASSRNQFPSIGGVVRSAGVVRELKKMRLLPIVIASEAWRSSK